MCIAELDPGGTHIAGSSARRRSSYGRLAGTLYRGCALSGSGVWPFQDYHLEEHLAAIRNMM